MKFLKILSAAIAVVAAFSVIGPVRADPVDFTFTGTGDNGSSATGQFTVDDSLLYPGYFSPGSVFSSLSLTISNIPGGGPASVDFDLNDLPFTWFLVSAGGVAYIAPYGGHDFGAPFFNHYDLNQPSQPFPGLPTFQTQLTYNGGNRDLITWSAASRVEANVPEAGSTAAYISMALVVCAAGMRRRMRRA